MLDAKNKKEKENLLGNNCLRCGGNYRLDIEYKDSFICIKCGYIKYIRKKKKNETKLDKLVKILDNEYKKKIVLEIQRSKENKCTICQNNAQARGLCNKHYKRLLRNGDPMIKHGKIENG